MSEIESSLIPVEAITEIIHLIRGQKVILDADLARLYGVTTQRLNQQVRRNISRFPSDFMFQLTKEEMSNLMSQIVISSSGHGGTRKLPFVFTEHGAVMAASVLNSPQAVAISVFVVRAFIKFREMMSAHLDLSNRLDELEMRLETRIDTHDQEISAIIQMIRELMVPPDSESQRKIGYRQPREED